MLYHRTAHQVGFAPSISGLSGLNLKPPGDPSTTGGPQPNGMSTLLFSISATEGRNIVLRNLIGKVAANLALVAQLHEPSSPMQVCDCAHTLSCAPVSGRVHYKSQFNLP